MKLAALNPRWTQAHGREGRIGVSFDCPGPCCAGKPLSEVDTDHVPSAQTKERLFVPFANPPGGAEPLRGNGPLWQRTGETFEDLTLTPSVDASHFGHWHGFVTNGECT